MRCLLITCAVCLSACSSDSSDPTVPIANDVQHSCETVNVDQLMGTAASFSTSLPADLDNANRQIQLISPRVETFSAFDASSGQLTLDLPKSRLPQTIQYQVVDADDVVVSEHEHKLIYTPLRIMPLGDSITSGVEYFDGIDTPSMDLRVGYRKFLYDALTEQGYSIDFEGQGGQSAGAGAGLIDPDNNGYPGVDIAFLIAKLDIQLDEDPVDVILLHIGTNNTPTTAEAITSWLDTLAVWENNNNAVTAMVASIVPKRDADQNAIVEQFNTDLKKRIEQRENDRVVWVDQNAALDIQDISLEPIGIHPSAAGYEKMADQWRLALINEKLLQRCDQQSGD